VFECVRPRVLCYFAALRFAEQKRLYYVKVKVQLPCPRHKGI